MSRKMSDRSISACMMVLAPLEAFAQQQPQSTEPQGFYWHGPWQMWSRGYGWPSWWWMCPLLMLVMVLIGVGIFRVVRPTRGGGPRRETPDPANDDSRSALQILSDRFARGEIEEDEYMQRKLAIHSDR